jgi:hypothetical protein
MARCCVSPTSRIILTAALALLAGVGPEEGGALAQSRQRSSARALPDCQLLSGGESTVLAIAGPQTLRLADGRFVRLAEILVPAGSSPGFDPSLAAVSYLRRVALGRKVEVKFGGTQRDRYGLYLGQVYVAGEAPLWLQEGLTASGFALAFPQADNHACSQRLLGAESEARSEKRGHWGLAYFKVLEARDPRSILNLVQTYQIVEGTPDSASESGGRITLHFGSADKAGFSAILEPAVKKRLADKLPAEAWAGLAVRIRGWVDRKRGPAIPVSLPEQIEFVSQRPEAPDGKPQGVP